MKKERSFAPPSSAGHTSGKGQRLVPTGKHAKGRAAKVAFGQAVNPGFTKGAATKRCAKAKAKTEFLAQSSRDANRIASERALAQAYRDFYATPEGRVFAKEYGRTEDCDLRLPSEHPPIEAAPADGRDATELPDFEACGIQNRTRRLVNRGAHPVDALEPRRLSVEVEGLSDFEIKRVSETLGELLRWALDDVDIVQRGRRAIVIIAALRPDLAAGMHPDRQLMHAIIHDVSLDASELFDAGAVYGRFLEWIGRGPAISAIGERLDMTAYMLRPDLLPQNTLAKLGEILNKSRQAKDKLANCLRDTVAGLKALAMRPEVTRDRCRTAQVRAGLADGGDLTPQPA